MNAKPAKNYAEMTAVATIDMILSTQNYNHAWKMTQPIAFLKMCFEQLL